MINAMKISISISTNEDYIHYTQTFINSVKRHNPEFDIYLTSVDCTPDIPGVCVKTIKLDAPVSRKYLKDFSPDFFKYNNTDITKGYKNSLYSESMFASCYARYAAIPYLMDKYDYVITADVDMLLRAPISNLIGDYDFRTHFFVDSGNVVICEEGLQITKSTDAMKRFWLRFNEEYDKIEVGHGKWNVGSDIFYKLLNGEFSDIRLINLKLGIEDESLDENAVVWSGDCLKKNHELFKKEMSKYIL